MRYLKDLRTEISWFKNNPHIAYLDSAATALRPDCLLAKMHEYVEQVNTNPHNQDSTFSTQTVLLIQQTKQKLARLLNCRPNLLVFTPGATFGLNMISWFLAPFLKKNDHILLTNAEHASNILPWYEIRKQKQVQINFAQIQPKNNDFTPILKQLTSQTRIVSVANETNLFGNFFDANLLAQKIKQFNPNVFVVIDAVQFLAHNKMDLAHSQIDFLCATAHKMLGPTGIGLLYIHPDLINQIKPVVVGGGMNFAINRDGYNYAYYPECFEAGTPNIMAIYGWNSVLDYYLAPDFETIKHQVYALKHYLDQQLQKLNDVVVVNPNINAFNTVFYHKKVFSQDLAYYLGCHNVIVRSGWSCAKLAYEIINQPLVRVSLHFYNNQSDVDQLIYVLKSYQKGAELDGII